MSWLTSDEATERLGIERQTLYAYVSRGLVTSRKVEGSRRSEYLEQDIAKLEAKKRWRDAPEKAAEEALDWGPASIESSITLVRDGQLFFRGVAFEDLADARIETVGALLWDTDELVFELSSAERLPPHRRSIGSALLDAEAADLDAWVFDRPGVVDLAWRVVSSVYSRIGVPAESLAHSIAGAWGVLDHAALIELALVSCADHELNVSAFTARCAASAGANLYHACLAGYSAATGHKHTGRVEELYYLVGEFETHGMPEVVRRMRRSGVPVHGFGHPLYPDGDPRAANLLKSIEAAGLTSADIAARQDLGLDPPSIDLALALMTRGLGLTAEHGVLLFMLGRLFGWIAHCIEAYENNRLIRPRARYVGQEPGSRLWAHGRQ